MNQQVARCDTLLEATAGELNEDVVALMLVAVQKDNLGLSVNLALKRSAHQFEGTMGGNHTELCRVYSSGWFNRHHAKSIVQECLFPFPYLWASVYLSFVVHAHDNQRRLSRYVLTLCSADWLT